MLWIRSHIAAPQDIWTQAVFRLHFAFDVLTVPHWRYSLPVQPQDELWIIRSGRCEIQQGKRSATAQSGDLVVLRAGEPRLTIEPDGQPLELLGFGFSATLLNLDIVQIWQPPLCFHDSSTHIAPLMQELARENLQESPAYGLQMQALAQQIFARALRVHPPGEACWQTALARLRAAQDGAIGEALRYIEAHFQQPLDLEKLSRAVHLSPKHLSRKFKNALGVAPSDYWRNFRLQQARSLLIGGEENIARVALRCGFDDAAYFSRAFKKQFGASPQQFRAAIGQMLRS